MSIFNSIKLFGNKSFSTISVEDGKGRIQWYWNVNKLNYMISDEPAFLFNIPVIGNSYLNINWAPPGKEGTHIKWRSDFSITNKGNVGIGMLEPSHKLEVDGIILNKEKHIIKGNISSFINSIQDGSGRLQWYWNSTCAGNDNKSKYIVSNEPAFKLNVPIISKNYFNINWAPEGKINETIKWHNHLSILNNGNVGINTIDPMEKLEVNGTILANDIILKNDNFEKKITNSKFFIDTICNTIKKKKK